MNKYTAGTSSNSLRVIEVRPAVRRNRLVTRVLVGSDSCFEAWELDVSPAHNLLNTALYRAPKDWIWTGSSPDPVSGGETHSFFLADPSMSEVEIHALHLDVARTLASEELATIGLMGDEARRFLDRRTRDFTKLMQSNSNEVPRSSGKVASEWLHKIVQWTTDDGQVLKGRVHAELESEPVQLKIYVPGGTYAFVAATRCSVTSRTSAL